MIDFEWSSSATTSKFNRSGNSKENKNLSGKRKSESVRTCYYALRKRICNEPINSLDLGFLFAPGENNYSGNGDESGNYMLGEAISNHLGFRETNLDPMHCAFPQVLANGDAATGHNGTAHVFHTTMHNQIEGNFSAQAVNIQGDMLHMVGENSTLVRHGSGIEDSGNGGDLPVHNLFQADDLMMKSISTFDQINSGTVNVCSEFEENQVFNSPIAECDASFQNLEYPSPLPDMSIWKHEEIPCNDDIIFPSELPTVSGSSAQQSFKEAGDPSSASVKHSSGSQKTTERGSVLKQRDQKGFRQPHAASQVIGSKMKLEKGQCYVIGNCKVKPEDLSHLASKSVCFCRGDSTKIDYVDGIIDTIQPSMLKDGSKENILQNHLNHNLAESLMEKPAVASNGHNSYPQSNANCIKQEFDASEASQDHQASEAEPVDKISTPVVEPSIDLEELPLQSDDDDVPYFSDIEAMVLNMDLDPEDHNLYDQEVARYQHEDTKRGILRLEQCACSYMQRVIASHGAFTILYGRHSKHYIKKPEVFKCYYSAVTFELAGIVLSSAILLLEMLPPDLTNMCSNKFCSFKSCSVEQQKIFLLTLTWVEKDGLIKYLDDR
ncbi:hypothetical protein SLA2020_222420 [Shorea laevis]